MKKKLIVLLTFLIVLTVGFIVWYLTPSQFLKNVSPDDVKYIHVVNGNNGSTYSVGDKEQILYILDNLQNISLKKSGMSLGRKGYLYRLNFEAVNGKTSDEFIINSSGAIRKDPFFYRDETNSICAEYIGNILLAAFHGADFVNVFW